MVEIESKLGNILLMDIKKVDEEHFELIVNNQGYVLDKDDLKKVGSTIFSILEDG